MVDPKRIFDLLTDQGIEYFCGVPDSLLKDFCAYLTDHADTSRHVITANEGNAIALAAGYFLGTGHAALVYLQNSGIGNAINPLTSLADREVYSIPMLLMIGWRGEPGCNDEPQHVKQGRIMTSLLDALEIPWYALGDKTGDPKATLEAACGRMRQDSAPVALLVQSGAFAEYSLQKQGATNLPLSREAAVRRVVDALAPEDLIVSTTGKASRELYEYRIARGDSHGRDFLTVGSMGHTASIAMGLARAQPARRIVCLDGDGSVIMHMGALAVIGQSSLPNLLHVVLNNGAHESVGGQPTVGLGIDLPTIAAACGYRNTVSVANDDDLRGALIQFKDMDGPALLEVKVNVGSRKDLGRPKTTPRENRFVLMRALGVEPTA